MSSGTAGGGANWQLIQLLAEPTRRRVFDLVRSAGAPMTRDAVATEAGIGRRLAAFHLDLLAEAGLLTVDYARPMGRSGPGAGRPAKRYRAAEVDLELTVPTRRYDVAARILARAITESPGDAAGAAATIAREEGRRLGELRRPGGRLSAAATLAAAEEVLADVGYEPQRSGGECVRLRNCPFHAVVDVAPALVCGVNDTFITGILEGMRGHRSVTAALDGAAPDCCVTVARR
ncbi:MAG TPA: helix-turn-helix domain-containing protein [Mycobacteriales bacterium]|nr:helix-turn-helix domain-containing protein [Mycobacteriales bacterium]